MNPQEIEVTLKVLEERMNIQESRLKDVDECCGKLKGALNSEMRGTSEQIVRLEQKIDVNKKDMEIQIKSLEEKTKTQFNEISEVKDSDNKLSNKIDKLDEKLDKKISNITRYYITISFGILTCFITAVLALLK